MTPEEYRQAYRNDDGTWKSACGIFLDTAKYTAEYIEAEHRSAPKSSSLCLVPLNNPAVLYFWRAGILYMEYGCELHPIGRWPHMRLAKRWRPAKVDEAARRTRYFAELGTILCGDD